MMKPIIIFILGPTSSGKSAVAAALAGRINGEVISCDSMQVYKDMDIITQAPGDDILSLAPHHLLRFLDPKEPYSAARYSSDAEKEISGVISRSHVPVFAGGTGLYVKALVDGIIDMPAGNEKIRRGLEKEALEKGSEYLHGLLFEADPHAAARLHPNDVRRVVRALEIHELGGRAVQDSGKEKRGIFNKYDIKMFGLDVPREDLYARIENNVERMFSAGLVEEVRRLLEKGPAKTALQALGIKEVSAYIDGAMTLKEVREELKMNTRRYAKRQLTWFRADKRIEWVNAARRVEEIVQEIVDQLKGRL
ncbi:MAG: tRNA (adenosine(37)-N6)-dimethylallyltransferase MiaA [Candidatus Omnitrophica bacterium]|nr:tRNA (adenosine(37)-N6)-dimethylallyltransferase MiaA [Candidatus Omnitrophota bacterium]